MSPTTHRVAALLHSLGWSSPNDAQWGKLDAAIANGRLVAALFSAERDLRDELAAQEHRENNS